MAGRRRRTGHAGSRRARSTARRTLARALIGGLGLLLAAALGGIGWLVIVYPKHPAGGRGREVRVEVAASMELEVLAERLAGVGAIEDPRLFAIYARLLGADDRLRDGEILLSDDMSPGDVLARVARGFGAATVRVTVPEGFDRFRIAARLARWGVCDEADFVRATEDPELLAELGIEGPSAEGYLFPDTYRLAVGLDAEEVVRRFVANWRRRVEPIYAEAPEELRWLESELSWGPHQALILASIVEKEAAVSEERPVIARVFINRLRDPDFRPKRLQADPTVSYGCRAHPDAAPSCAGFDGAITRAMLSDRQNAYNTYRHEGLPPGPICNPGLSSIRAVVHADPNDYLYFVARGHGRHSFSATLDEHNEAVERYRRGTP